MPCSTVSSLASSTRSSAYFTVWIVVFRSLQIHLELCFKRIGCTCRIQSVTTSLSNLCSNLHTSCLGPSTICWTILFRATRYQFPLGFALLWSVLHGQVSSASLMQAEMIAVDSENCKKKQWYCALNRAQNFWLLNLAVCKVIPCFKMLRRTSKNSFPLVFNVDCSWIGGFQHFFWGGGG